MNIEKRLRRTRRALLFIVLLLFVCRSDRGATQQVRRVLPRARSLFVFQPIRLAGRAFPVTIEVRGKPIVDEFGRPRIGDVTASFLSVRHGKRTVLSSATLSDFELFMLDVSLYQHRKSGQYLLAIEDNAGQYDHTQVYRVDARPLRLVPLFEHGAGVLQGDPRALAQGILVEHTYEHYVTEHPTGHGFVHRTWRYHPATHRFTPGRLIWER